MMTPRQKQSFIESQMIAFHDYLHVLLWYRSIISKIYRQARCSLRLPKASVYSNFRDVFWHYRKMSAQIADVDKAHVQYEMMLEHLNWALVDSLVELLQLMYEVHTTVALEANIRLQKDDETPIFYPAQRAAYVMIRESAKDGYLLARKALMMMRSRISSIYRPIAAQTDFDSAGEYAANTDYFLEILDLFALSFERLLVLRPRNS